MSDGWGLDPWGLGPWGAESSTPLSIVSAVAISTHEVQVVLAAEPQHHTLTSDGDALNPATWNVQRLDNGFTFNVMAVRIGNNNLTYILTVVQPFAPVTIQHRVSTTTLLDASGNAITPPTSADFAGLQAETELSPQTKLAAKKVSLRDIANPQNRSLGGTLIVSTSGDYASEAGVPLLRKLIIRRLISRKGDFFHLPDYGVGLRVKEPLPAADLVLLKAEIERQILNEPEVEQVAASLALATNGVLTINVKAKLRVTGQEVSAGLAVSQSGVVVL